MDKGKGAGTGTGTEAGTGTGTEAGTGAGTEAGIDTGTEAGTEPIIGNERNERAERLREMQLARREGQRDAMPLEYYQSIYEGLDPGGIAARTGLSWDGAAGRFSLTFVANRLTIAWPHFALYEEDGSERHSPYETVLLAHYLCEGVFVPATGREIAYKELPWGDVYERNFQGRAIGRYAWEFGRDIPSFCAVMEGTPALGAQPLEKCDAGYRFFLMDGLPMSIRLWEGDEEFPTAAQILFDENFRFAFTAEDVAGACDALLYRLRDLRKRLAAAQTGGEA
ncbi:MAG: DUF3786 domain-containing protein [Clostridiales Family XIII bacterium]|nr:DUF3786 domain-containing protein [Clostridiales Family XIII bacterium]